ncbi:unnamed protein product [Closterium sp. NIES-54]
MATPDWLTLLKKDVDVSAYDWAVIHAGMYAMYAASARVEEDCFSYVHRVARVEAASLGAFDTASTGAEPEEVLHTFTLDSAASRCFFRDSSTVTSLIVHVPVTLADPSGGPVVARGATVLPCLAAPSGLLTGLHLPSLAKNLVATSVLQDQWVTATQPGGELVAICTDSRTSEHLATFTQRPGSGLYTLTTESLPPLPRSLAPPYLPCVKGRKRPAPHSSFPPTTAPLQTLHMDVWGLARITGQGGERYFLLVVDDYTCYTPVFPLQSKADIRGALIRWFRAVRLQLRARFRQDLPVLQLHSDRGDPPPLVEPLEVSLDTSGPAEGGDQTATDTMAPRRSGRLVVPPGFQPRPSSLPLWHVTVDSGAAGGGDTRGADSGGACSGGAASPTGTGGAGGAATGGSAGGGAGGAGAGGAGARGQETLSPGRLREWAVRWGGPGGGAGRARASCSGGAGPGGTSAGVPGVGRARGTSAGGTGATGGTGGAAAAGVATGSVKQTNKNE